LDRTTAEVLVTHMLEEWRSAGEIIRTLHRSAHAAGLRALLTLFNHPLRPRGAAPAALVVRRPAVPSRWRHPFRTVAA